MPRDDIAPRAGRVLWIGRQDDRPCKVFEAIHLLRAFQGAINEACVGGSGGEVAVNLRAAGLPSTLMPLFQNLALASLKLEQESEAFEELCCAHGPGMAAPIKPRLPELAAAAREAADLWHVISFQLGRYFAELVNECGRMDRAAAALLVGGAARSPVRNCIVSTPKGHRAVRDDG